MNCFTNTITVVVLACVFKSIQPIYTLVNITPPLLPTGLHLEACSTSEDTTCRRGRRPSAVSPAASMKASTSPDHFRIPRWGQRRAESQSWSYPPFWNLESTGEEIKTCVAADAPLNTEEHPRLTFSSALSRTWLPGKAPSRWNHWSVNSCGSASRFFTGSTSDPIGWSQPLDNCGASKREEKERERKRFRDWCPDT